MTEPTTDQAQLAFKQPAVLLLAEPGCGKTFSLSTIARKRKLFCLFTDPGGEESLIEGLMHYNIPIDNVHWHYISPSSQGWSAATDMLSKVNTMSYEDLGKLKSGIQKAEHRQLMAMLAVLSDFTCQRTGESFGPVDKFPADYAFALDGLSGVNDMARELTVGAKPTLHQGEWGTAMQTQISLLKKIVYDVRCMTVVIGHIDKLLDQILGSYTFQVSLLGSKNAPVLPRMFSDVIWAYREQTKFYWSTINDKVSGLKGRNLGMVDKVQQDFAAIISAYERRLEYAGVTTPLSVPSSEA